MLTQQVRGMEHMRTPRSALSLIGTVLCLVAAACSGAPQTAPAPTSPPAAATAAPAAAPAQGQTSAADEAAWEKQTYAAAKTEGKLTVYGFWNPDLERVTREFLAEKYPGVELETLTT